MESLLLGSAGDWLWGEIIILFFTFIWFWIIIRNQVTLKCSCLVLISINILSSIYCELGTKLLKMHFPFFSDKSNICLFKGNRKLKKSTKKKVTIVLSKQHHLYYFGALFLCLPLVLIFLCFIFFFLLSSFFFHFIIDVIVATWGGCFCLLPMSERLLCVWNDDNVNSFSRTPLSKN